MNVVTERARELQKVFRRVVAYKGEEGREREGGKVNVERELKKRHVKRGEKHEDAAEKINTNI